MNGERVKTDSRKDAKGAKFGTIRSYFLAPLRLGAINLSELISPTFKSYSDETKRRE